MLSDENWQLHARFRLVLAETEVEITPARQEVKTQDRNFELIRWRSIGTKLRTARYTLKK